MERSHDYAYTGLTAIGVLRLPPEPDAWRGTHLTGKGGPILGVPRRPMLFRWADAREGEVGTSAVALFSNRDQAYHKTPLSERGEETDWVWLRRDLTAQIVGEFDPDAAEDADNCFAHMVGPAPSRTLLGLRRLTSPFAPGPRGEQEAELDPLAIDEAAIRVVGGMVRASYEARGQRRRRSAKRAGKASTRAAYAAAVNEGAEFIAVSFAGRVLLEDVAAAACLSPLHYCRIFRTRTGMTVHTYLTRVRIAEAMERLADDAGPLDPIARGCGFASASHLSDAFVRHAGLRPSMAREAVRAGAPAALRSFTR